MKKLLLLFLCLLMPAGALAETVNSCEGTMATGNRLVKDGWIYQVMGVTDESAQDTPSYRIARAPLDAPADWQTVFGPATHYIGFLCDMGDSIAFADNSHSVLYAMDADGSNPRMLYESPTPIEAMLTADDALYFCNYDGLYRYDEAGGLSQLYAARHRMARFFARVDDVLIFSVCSPDESAPADETGLFTISLNGSGLCQLTCGEPASFTVHGDTLYTAIEQPKDGDEVHAPTMALNLATGEQTFLCERTFTYRQQTQGCYSVGEQAADGYHLYLLISNDGDFDPDSMRAIELDDRQFLLNDCMTFINDDSSLTMTPLSDWLAAH